MIIILPENGEERGTFLRDQWYKDPKILVLAFSMSSFQREGGAAIFGRVKFHVEDKLKSQNT